MRGIYLTVREIRTEGLPDDGLVRAGRTLIGHAHGLHSARPVPSYPVRKGQPVAWQTNTGDYLFSVTHWIELSEPLPDHVVK